MPSGCSQQKNRLGRLLSMCFFWFTTQKAKAWRLFCLLCFIYILELTSHMLPFVRTSPLRLSASGPAVQAVQVCLVSDCAQTLSILPFYTPQQRQKLMKHAMGCYRTPCLSLLQANVCRNDVELSFGACRNFVTNQAQLHLFSSPARLCVCPVVFRVQIPELARRTCPRKRSSFLAA